MSCRETLERLDDFVDGRLGPAEARRLREHLSGCLACSRELAALRRLEEGAARLPGIAPSRDLWPAIRARIQGSRGAVAAAASTPSTHAHRWWPWAAAALLALAVLLPRLADRTGPAPVAPRGSRAAAEATPRALLAETLEARRAELPAESVAAFESDLELLDRAIRELERALESAPESRRLRLLLAERRQQEAELLKLLARA